MEKRLLLAFVLSVLVLIVFQCYLAKMAPHPFPPKAVNKEEEPLVSHPFETEAPRAELEAGEAEVETSLFKALINLNGGGMVSWHLKAYKDKEGERINLVRPGRMVVNLPLNIVLPGTKSVIFQADKSLKLDQAQPQGEILLQSQNDIWKISKRLTFNDQSYLFWLELIWENLSPQRMTLPDYYLVGPAGFGPGDKENQQYAEIKAAVLNGGRLQTKRWRVSSLVQQLLKWDKKTQGFKRLEEEKPGPFSWIASRVKYFTVVIKPEKEIKGLHFSGLGENDVLCRLKMPGGELNPGEILRQRLAVYLGPMDYTELSKANLGLESIFDQGGLAPLRRLVMQVLTFFYNRVGNWGIAIILLTIVAKIVLLPLTHRSFRSMKELQKLQPQINSLRQVYKDNPQRLQKEIMELYRRHKVNPLGGCFPMLLQMPVFIALFTALRSAIELRQAPFIFWIKDLSAKDPFYVLPILMGGVMFWQQKLTPQADPQQARMGMFFSIFLTFLFMNFPSGLVLYWLINSFLSLTEQWWIKKDPK